MSKKVKVKVSDHHFKANYSIGDKTVSKHEATEVEPNITVANAVKAGTLQIVEGELPAKFRGADPSRTETEETDESEEETEEPEFDGKTKDELKEMLESRGLKKSGAKDELVERLKNYE